MSLRVGNERNILVISLFNIYYKQRDALTYALLGNGFSLLVFCFCGNSILMENEDVEPIFRLPVRMISQMNLALFVEPVQPNGNA